MGGAMSPRTASRLQLTQSPQFWPACGALKYRSLARIASKLTASLLMKCILKDCRRGLRLPFRGLKLR
jgi:hypothetical protein